MNLEPQIAEYVAYCEQFDVPLGFDTVALQRERYNAMRRSLARPVPETLYMEDGFVQGQEGHKIPIRMYRSSQEANQACCLFMHGGGFVVGNLETHHDWVAELAALSGVTIIAIDYRLSPEYHYPAALHDVRDVLKDVLARAGAYRINPERIAATGDSAGGNLAAAICSLSRDSGLATIKAQLLIYPGLGTARTPVSYQEQADAPLLKTSELNFYYQAYLGNGQADKYAFPLLEHDYSGLPPAFILTVEVDPIRDDGFSYAAKLREVGIPVEHYNAPGLVHGCMQARQISPGTRKAFDLWARALKKML